ncbi:MAG: hypothetical protein K8R54_04880 [Bacteroidales bacterium]|nr:hypothetical protein [Bacteroidales bacterium]
MTEKNYSIPEYGKNGELALFYNIAYNRINLFIAHFEEKSNKKKWEIRKLFKDEEDIYKPILKDETYIKLKEFVFRDIKGGDRHITENERKQYNQLLFLLLRVRDYHSHYYHSDTGLYVYNKFTKQYLEKKCELAKQAYPGTEENYRDFVIFDDNDKLTDQGINFFLGFFLTKGMMNLFSDNRERLKNRGIKTEGAEIKDFNYHRHICKFYSLKDSHAIHNAFLPKNKFQEINPKEFLDLQITNYLETLPSVLYNELSEEEKERTSERRENKFMQTAATWLMLHKSDDNIKWRVWSPEQEKTEIKKNKDKTHGKIPLHRMEYIKKYANTLTGDERIRIKEKNVEIQVKTEDNKYAYVRLSLTELMAWVYLTFKGNYDDALDKIKDFVHEFSIFTNNLYNNKKTNIEDNNKLNRFNLPQVLLNLNNNIIHQSIEDIIHQSIEDRKQAVISKIEGNGDKQKGLLHWLKHENPNELAEIKTSIFNTTKKIRQLDETEDDNDEEKAEARQDLRHDKGIRYKKMKIIQTCFKFMFGKKARFTSADEKNNFKRYCYLMDFIDYEQNSHLITDWKDKLGTRKAKNKNNTDEKPSHLLIIEKLLADNKSFDTFYKKIINETCNYLEGELSKLKSGQYSDKFFPVLARRLNVASKNLEESFNYNGNRKKELFAPYKSKRGIHFNLPVYFFQKLSDDIKKDGDWYHPYRINRQTYYYKQIKNYINSAYMQAVNELWAKVKEKEGEERKKERLFFEKAKDAQNQFLQDSFLNELQLSNKQNIQNFKLKQGSFIKNIENIKVVININTALDADNFITPDRLSGIIKRIKHNNNEKALKKIYTLKELKTEIKKHWTESREFISALLELEKNLNKDFNSNTGKDISKKDAPKLTYIGFNDILSELNLSNDKAEKYKDARNDAFHGDILKPEFSYETLTNEIKDLKNQL